MENEEIRIVYEEERNRSAAYDGNKNVGYCEYTISSSTWTIIHTVVVPSYNGRGIAKALVLAIIEEARKRNIKIVPLCSYALKMMTKTDEYQDVLAK